MSHVKCPTCGTPNVVQVDIDKYQCPYCGESFTFRENQQQQAPQTEQQGIQSLVNTIASTTKQVEGNDNPNMLLLVVCLFLPLIGVILYFVHQSKKPRAAKAYILWSLIGVVATSLFGLIF